VETSIQKPAVDFVLENHFSIFVVRPVSDAAKAWVEENVGCDSGFHPDYPMLVVEHRYVSDLVQGILGDGLSVR
jgi:hypothetical protein